MRQAFGVRRAGSLRSAFGVRRSSESVLCVRRSAFGVRQDRSPRRPAIVGRRDVGDRLGLLRVVPADDHAVPCVPERDREDACRFARRDWRGSHRPGAAGVGRVQHPRGRRADPDVRAVHGDVRAAGRERALRGQRRREGDPWGHASSARRHPSVVRIDELAIHRVTERDTVRRIGERHRIEEDLRVVIGELQRPRAAAVRRSCRCATHSPGPMLSTDATRSSMASMSRKSSASAPGTGRGCQVAPPSVVRSTVPLLAADPGDLRRHDAHAPQPHRHAAVERLPAHRLLGESGRQRWPRARRTRREQSSWRGLYRSGLAARAPNGAPGQRATCCAGQAWV